MDSLVNELALSAGQAPLFLLSFRYRDELVDAAERAGWYAIAGRRSEAVERRFISSGAAIAVVDARGAIEDGLAATRLLAEPSEANAAALVILVSASDIGRLDEAFAAGATHYLASPFGEQEFGQALRFASRYVARLSGGEHAILGRGRVAESDEYWRWKPGSDSVELSAALARQLPSTSSGGRALLRLLDSAGRGAALRALRRVRETGRPTAFAHFAPGSDRVRIAQHLSCEHGSGKIVGRVEHLGAVSAPGMMTSRDSLTGLADRSAALRWIAQEIGAGDSVETECILLLLSISRFDAINAAYGRATGDAVIRATARRIERLVSGFASRRHMIARLAGAEFAIALIGSARNGEARLLAEQLNETAARPFVSADTVITLSCRIGGTTIEAGECDAALLLRRASAALAEAKASEASVPKLLDASGHAATEVANRLEIDLRAALDQDEIDVLFQPQLSVTTGAVIGVEALARWRHPELGELGAEPLFMAAERSDYLVQLSRHIQRKALQIAAANCETFRWLRLSINVTAADIAQRDFAMQFLAMVDDSGFDRKRVTVEVTESGLIEDLALAANLLSELRHGGLKVAIDDFGTGYSSLAYLKALPLDYLKIDPQLSQDIAGSARDRVVVTGLIEMAKSLGLSVIAEGVESDEQLSLLAAAGCNVYQGFLFSPAISATELGLIMRGKKTR